MEILFGAVAFSPDSVLHPASMKVAKKINVAKRAIFFM
jgi:hypothetical protein